MSHISVGEKVEYIGTDTKLWRKEGIVRFQFEYNSCYDYTAFIVDFAEAYGIVVPDINLKLITPRDHP